MKYCFSYYLISIISQLMAKMIYVNLFLVISLNHFYCLYLLVNVSYILLKNFQSYYQLASVFNNIYLMSINSISIDHIYFSFHPVSTGCIHFRNRTHRSWNDYFHLGSLKDNIYFWINILNLLLPSYWKYLSFIHQFYN